MKFTHFGRVFTVFAIVALLFTFFACKEPGDPEPIYSISLSQAQAYTFLSATQGYGTQAPLSVSVSNTGNEPTGALTVALSGTDAGSFTLSAASLQSIAVGGTGTFTVRPNNGLGASTYTATVTVTGGNSISASFGVSFTVTSSNVAVTGVFLNKSTISLNVDGTETLTAIITPSNATNQNLTWSSDDTEVATVSTSGLVTGIALGSAIITVTTQDGGHEASCVVVVLDSLTSTNFTISGTTKTYDGEPQGITAGYASPVLTEATAGEIIVYYSGNGYTVYTESTIAPTNAGIYNVSIETTGGTTYAPFIKTFVGTLTINKKQEPFTNHSEFNLTYIPNRKLADLQLQPGYVWDEPETLVNAGNNQFPATIIYPDGNREAKGTINVNVSKATGTFVALQPIYSTYIADMTLGDVALPTCYAWDMPETLLTVANSGQSFSAAYTDPSGNYEPASGSITVNVAKADGANVDSPTMAARTHNSITINAVTASTGQDVEYAISINNTAPVNGWQSGLTFDGLNSNTKYYIFARATANVNYEIGVASSVEITTMSGMIIYYWVNEQTILATAGSTTVTPGQTCTIIAQGTGYTNQRWSVNGVLQSAANNRTSYSFSSPVSGKYNIGLLVEKDGRYYDANFVITVKE